MIKTRWRRFDEDSGQQDVQMDTVSRQQRHLRPPLPWVLDLRPSWLCIPAALPPTHDRESAPGRPQPHESGIQGWSFGSRGISTDHCTASIGLLRGHLLLVRRAALLRGPNEP
ncbi:hypothetical protein QIS74_05526 [Colletotrichum tabaci]|uniref:Uncharacterized protein n=1 Tax=Colletotrichum tabaci TaxID=1209068 RepID=A0AAV9TH32_9PEZI